MNNKTSLFHNNPFTDAFQEFDEEAFFENLHNQVKNKSYFEKYKGFKTTILWLSYLFNAASALTASYAIYWLAQWITGLAIVGYIVAAVFLFFLEKIKRKSSTEFWQVLFFRKELAVGWLGLSLFCLGLSLLSSSFGVKEGTENLSPSAETIASDSLATSYRGEIAKLEAENDEFKKQRNHEGVIYHRTQASIKANKKMIADYQTRILELDEKLTGKNEQLSNAYAQDVQLTAWTLVWLTILMELLFEACIAYVWYYYFRSYVERTKVKSTAPPPPTPHDQTAELMMLVQNLQDEISLLKATKSNSGLPPPPHQNSTNGVLENSATPPIGFFSEKQRNTSNTKTTSESSVQTCPDVDRTETDTTDDKYTIEHQYQKNGRQKVVRYTLRMVNSRVGQYQRELADAIEKQMEESIIDNRRQWLSYWKCKQTELQTKINA